MPSPRLPRLPEIRLEIVARRDAPHGFLDVERFELITRTGDRAEPSASFPYDVVARRALDACVMVAHHREEGRVMVWLRSAVRPPVYLRTIEPLHRDGLWELPAGLVEPGESPRAAAAREVVEELGFAVAEADMEPLGPWALPAPGLIGEIHHFFHVAVDPAKRAEPAGDGSPLEAGASLLPIALEEALAACRAGEIRDGKTELALRRFAELGVG